MKSKGSIESLLSTEGEKYVFVGGKGGVGKSTTSSSIAVLLSKHQNVLLISSDPAHNLRDCFPGTEFGAVGSVTRISDTLHALEISSTTIADEIDAADSPMLKEMKHFISELPGIDEGSALASLAEHSEKYDRVVIDTAPTGHTLRLLSLPKVLGAAIDKLNGMDVKLGGLWSRVTGSQDEASKLKERLERYKAALERLAHIFTDPNQATFVVVCIAEFLSVFESSRLIRELGEKSVDCRYVVVNQLLPASFASLNSEDKLLQAMPDIVSQSLRLSGARARIQAKYLQHLQDALGDDHTIVRLPLLESEPRGIDALERFAENLVTPNAALYPESSATTRLTDDLMKETLQKLQAELRPPPSKPTVVAPPNAEKAAMPPVNVQMQVMTLLTKPNGIQMLIAHPEVKKARSVDPHLDALFRDLELAGMFGALSHMGNPSVREGLTQLLPKIQDLLA